MTHLSVNLIFVTIVTLTPYLRKPQNETSITKIDTKRREDRNVAEIQRLTVIVITMSGGGGRGI